MKHQETPVLDPRDAVQVFDELLKRRPAYVPEWVPSPDGSASALLQIFSRYMQVVVDRLNQAPDKNLLGFLDVLGISLIPARGARAPVVFQPQPNATNGRITAGIRLGAQIPDRSDPVMFETESSIAMAAGRLVEVVTLRPTLDEYANHSLAVAGGQPFTLFESPQAVPHEFYLAHDTLFALSGKSTVEIEFELSNPGDTPLAIAWEFWDGQGWRPFRAFDSATSTASQDGTEGLTRSGIVTLRVECGQPEKSMVQGINAYWVRGRLDQPLPPDPAQVLPMVDRIRIRTVIARPLPPPRPSQATPSTDGGVLAFASGESCPGGISPDQAFADGTSLDLSTTFFPFGRSPDSESVFYSANEEIFSKPGAQVALCFRKAKTPEEEADEKVAESEPAVDNAQNRLKAAIKNAAETVRNAAEGVIAIADQDEVSEFEAKKDALVAAIAAVPEDLSNLNNLLSALDAVAGAIGGVVVEVDRDINFSGPDNISDEKEHIEQVRSEAKQVADSGVTTIKELNKLNLIEAAAVDTMLAPPRLVWEYWNGQRWRSLIGSINEPGTNLLDDTGEFSFSIPLDLEPTSVNDVQAYWVRARVLSGSYNLLRLMSWYDALLKKTNLFPIIEARPPVLEAFFLGYTYRSPWERPEHCLTYNDFQFELHSHDVHWPGGFFPPFRPVADTTPALYLGFDQPLPNDLVSLYLDIEEHEIETPPLLWEAWDGTAWRVLLVTDETAGLQRPGMVSFIAPDVAARPQANIRQARGQQITVGDSLEAAVFQPGNQVVIRHEKTRELATVQDIQGEVILLETPLRQAYSSGVVILAALPRFGTSYDWVRARLKDDGRPVKSLIRGLHLNAAWAVQVQTLRNEVLGSGIGHPNQTLFFSQTPVLPGEDIEVRELTGARAQVELPMLTEELFAQGFSQEDIRQEFDRRTGAVTEVWVRWRLSPHLSFSGPDDRHYIVERAGGRLIFGDGRHGRLPTVGANNIQARRYQAGGGVFGNVPAGSISQLLGAAPFVQAVTNPRAAEGGADSEIPERVRTRGPEVLRHRYRALAARDYEALAREASPGLAAARALSSTAPNGRPAPGWVTVIIVPQSLEPQPKPSFEMRRQVHDYLAARAPVTLAPERIAVIGPTYFPIGVFSTIAPRHDGDAGIVERRVRATLEVFLHPLAGGPEGEGWPFGRDVYLSDVASVVEKVEGVDYVEELSLLMDGTPRGEHVEVPSARIVVAGTIQIEMKAAER